MSELRWNPLLGEWLVTATHRQTRTFLPPSDYCPLCPTREGGFPTEIPAGDYDIVVFDNRFPSFASPSPSPAIEPTELYQVKRAEGICEVVVYSSSHVTTLAEESVAKITTLIKVWIDRFAELGSRHEVEYVFIFENKGEAIGVTLHHPHGQIYGYPFIPVIIARELEQCAAHLRASGRCLLCDVSREEQRDGRRIVHQNDSFVAYVPFFARWPYEVHIVSVRHLQAIVDLRSHEILALAQIIKLILTTYDGLFDESFPYVMALHQRPTDGLAYEHYHFHIEFYPPMRAANRLKYLAGSEAGAGVFISDTLAEETAARLRSLCTTAVLRTEDART